MTKPGLRQVLTYVDDMLRTRQKQEMPPVVRHALELHKLMLKSALSDEPQDPLELLGLLDLIHRAGRFVKHELSTAILLTDWLEVSFMVAPIAALRRAVIARRYMDFLPRVASRLGLAYPSGVIEDHHETVLRLFSEAALKDPEGGAHVLVWASHDMGLDPTSVTHEADCWTKGQMPATILGMVAATLGVQAWGAAQEKFITNILARDFRDLALVHDGEDPAWGPIIPALRQTIIALTCAISNIRHYETNAAGFDVPGLIQHTTKVVTGEAERRYRKLFRAGGPVDVFQAHMGQAKQWLSEVWDLLVWLLSSPIPMSRAMTIESMGIDERSLGPWECLDFFILHRGGGLAAPPIR